MYNENKTETKNVDKQKTQIEKDIMQGSVQMQNKNNDTDLITAMHILASNENLESNTILDNEQVNGLTLMNWAGQVYDIEFCKYYVGTFPRYRISGDNGRGRKELIQIAEAIQRNKAEEQAKILDVLGRR